MIVSENIPKPLILVDRIFNNPDPAPKQSIISPRNPSKRGNSYSNQIAPNYSNETSYTKPDPVPFGGYYQSIQDIQARQYSNGYTNGNARNSNPKRTTLNKLLHNHNLRIREIFQYKDYIFFSCFTPSGHFCIMHMDNEYVSIEGDESVCERPCVIEKLLPGQEPDISKLFRNNFANFAVEIGNKKYIHYVHGDVNYHGINLDHDVVITEENPGRRSARKYKVTPVFSLRYFMDNNINFEINLESLSVALRNAEITNRGNKLMTLQYYIDHMKHNIDRLLSNYTRIMSGGLKTLEELKRQSISEYKTNLILNLHNEIISICGSIDELDDLKGISRSISELNTLLETKYR